MRPRFYFAATLVSLATARLAAAEPIKIAVMPTQFDESSAGTVPKLFDDYLLTAVQNAGEFEVIGQDDMNAMLGFEQQKSLLGCDDASCIADIGGALGVDKIVVVKIARLGEEWVTTCKLISIRDTRVEARTSDFTQGTVKDLLEAVPRIVGKLFGKTPGTASPSAASPAAASLAAAPDAVAAGQAAPGIAGSSLPKDGSVGRGARVGGIVTTSIGLGVAALGGLVSIIGLGGSSCDYDFATGTRTCGIDTGVLAVGQVVLGAGLLTGAIGSGIYLNGKARGKSGDPDAVGKYRWRWLGWVLAGAAVVAPIVGAAADQRAAALTSGILATLGSGFIFIMSMSSSSGYAVTSGGVEQPFASLELVPEGKRLQPHFNLALAF